MAKKSKRRISPEQRAGETREWLRQTSPLIGEAFPTVKSIKFKVHFTDWDGVALKSKWDFALTDADKAFFKHNCIAASALTWRDRRDRCEGGGFDFQHAVDRAVRDKILTGDEYCKGRRRERVCGLTAHYEISVVEASPEEAR